MFFEMFGKYIPVNIKKFLIKKEISKTKIIDKRSEKIIKTERDMIELINLPFIINMHFSFLQWIY